jgi:hypothetical protein
MSQPQFTAAQSLAERQAALIAKANAWNDTRKVRALEQMNGYRLLPDGGILNRQTGEIYHPVRTIERPTGPQHLGCDCEDFKGHVTRLRQAMSDAACSTALECKHCHLRRLLAGKTITVGNSRFTMKPQTK